MKKEQLEKLTTEELNKRHKQLKTITSFLAGILIFLFGVTAYNTFSTGKFDPMLITPIALAAIIPINLKQLKEIKRILEQRENRN
ncbi:redox-active disulfide protein 2 [Poritiphilus flavus]|uniref:Redox-active disulfide protein 2 n=1 Tax=Poritiphilus flavus TaxID=2697053 RepID=A0A6L9EFN0_9FLAO|nr:redox-active disulfide protein 2 [Poritiphilus flavus]NAS13544.1 redox-active disulfide protein 2 [Poritiphilus flavus]